MHDVTVSVWNRFWSFQLISGLTRGGFAVRALGTTRKVPDAASYQCCWLAALCTQLIHRFPKHKDRFIELALLQYEEFAARRTGGSRCFWGWSNGHLAAFKKARAAGIPVILETGSTHVRWMQKKLRDEYELRGIQHKDSLLDRRAPGMVAEYELADRICVPSRFVARTFMENGIPEAKLHVNAYGADVSFWSECRREPHPGRKPFVFVYTAQIMLRKGIGYLVDAWKHLGDADAELWLIGGVNPDCQGLLRDLPSSVRLLGGKNHTELREIYAKADVYVLPSLEEGLARSVLEAMAAGLPVIVTEETGATDVMVNGEDGWAVPSRNPEALAEAFRSALQNPEKAFERGKSARCRVQMFSWKSYGQRAAAFLGEVLGKPTAR